MYLKIDGKSVKMTPKIEAAYRQLELTILWSYLRKMAREKRK